MTVASHGLGRFLCVYSRALAGDDLQMRTIHFDLHIQAKFPTNSLCKLIYCNIVFTGMDRDESTCWLALSGCY